MRCTLIRTIEYGIDFVRIFKDVKNIEEEKMKMLSKKLLVILLLLHYAKANFTPDFYTKTLEV